MTQSVVMQTGSITIKRGGIELHISEGKQKLGRLVISNGSIEWLPKNKKSGTRLNWSKFAELMQSVK